MKGIQLQYLIVFLCITSMILSCTPDPDLDPDPDPCDTMDCDSTQHSGPLDTLWASKVIKNGSYAVGGRAIQTESDVILMYLNGGKSYIKSFNKDTGAENWKWNAFESSDKYLPGFVGDCFMVKYREHRALVNSITGKTVRHADIPYLTPRGWLDGDQFYVTENFNNQYSVKLYRSPTSDLSSFDTIYELNGSTADNDLKSIESVTPYIDPKTGAEMLLFQHRMALPDQVDVVAYSLEGDSIAWMHEDIEHYGNSNVRQFLVHDEKAYFLGGNTVYCFDLRSGDIVWEQGYVDELQGFVLGDILYASQEDLIIAKADDDRVYAYDPETGEEEWIADDVGWNGTKISYHDGIVYYTNSELYALDASDGSVIWAEESLSVGPQPFESNVLIDEERGVLYVMDRLLMYAIRLPEK